MFFDSWSALFRVIAVGVPAYLALVVVLRISGKRTLSKMNAFDFIVTVAMGSTLATIFLSAEVSLSEGLLALLLLVLLQFAITWTAQRSTGFRDAIKSEPTLLYFRGSFLEDALRRERVTKGEVLSAARASGAARLSEMEAVVLETDGTITAVRKDASGPDSTLRGVRGAPTGDEPPGPAPSRGEPPPRPLADDPEHSGG